MKVWWKIASKNETNLSSLSAGSLEARQGVDADRALASLTHRESEVLALLMQGLKLREIGDAMGIKFSTVNTHQKSIYRKLEVNSRTECFLRYGERTIQQ